MASRSTPLDVFCVCTSCRDMFTVTLWMRKHADGRFRALLERSRDVVSQDGLLYHRPGKCDGVVRVYDLPGPTVLES